ncbi:efflux RND transporter periplasmic adaptor subunit [Neisseriaceae bacterium TC5R-5]|nr:efflux RND transporter periplasmic adaptor subunit [Neisseriaceae bacterium TC5R-5]
MKIQGKTYIQHGGKWLLLTAMAVSLIACGKNKPAQQAMPAVPVGVIQVATADIPVTFEYTAQAEGSREIDVRARVGGILLKRTYEEGKPVKQGDLLFQIDPEPLKAALDQAKGNLQIQQAQLVQAKQNHERILPLFKENAVSQQDRDNAVAAYEAAKATVTAAQAQVQQASLNLGYARVTAPIGGLSSKASQSEGSLISTAGDAGLLTKIAQLDPIYINFNLSDQDMRRLRNMQDSGQLKMAGNGQFEAKLILSDGSQYDKIGRLNFTDNLIDTNTGTIRSRATFANPDGIILPGQFLRISLQGAKRANAIAIPQRAVLTNQQGKIVWVVGADNKVQPRPITVSQEVGHDVLVETGLKSGDKVVIDNIIKLQPGAPVKPHPFQAGASAPAAAQPAKG